VKERELSALRRTLEAEILERQEQIRAVEILLNRIRRENGTLIEGPVLTVTNGHHRRVRGTLKAAKTAVDAVTSPFTRSELLSKIEEINPALAGKIKPEALRMVIRTLIKDGLMAETEGVSSETGDVLYRNYALVE
jgi:hypothetical protein